VFEGAPLLFQIPIAIAANDRRPTTSQPSEKARSLARGACPRSRRFGNTLQPAVASIEDKRAAADSSR
jgi:hypothetical protein